jgi:hypothetical protein
VRQSSLFPMRTGARFFLVEAGFWAQLRPRAQPRLSAEANDRQAKKTQPSANCAKSNFLKVNWRSIAVLVCETFLPGLRCPKFH